MEPSESPSIISEYSQAFTTLQAGKRELIQWGVEAVVLNRYVVDAAGSTSEVDATPVLQSIDPNKVGHGTEQQCAEHGAKALQQLVVLQEQVNVLHKAAKESGISAGLLTIAGQAATQSPDDNGASVLRQLSELVGDNTIASADTKETKSTEIVPAVAASTTMPDEIAANDVDRLDRDRMTRLQAILATLIEHWRPLALDASVCVIATGIAISLIN